jgi:hypothetical protein
LYQQDAFRRDRAIARDDKRRRDGVQIKVLTHELVATLAEPELDRSEVVDRSEIAVIAGTSPTSHGPGPPLI